jgi:hypothetical protein
MASPLHNVGEHLAQKAVTEAGSLADAFGRSAFNRYYYAAYLTTRDLLGMVDEKWARQPHAAIPQLLQTTFISRIREQAKAHARAGAISGGDQDRLTRSASIAAASMAATLRTAYALRVTSDYEPQTAVRFAGGTFTLVDRSEGEARGWLTEIARSRATLIQILKDLGLAN